VSKYIRPFSRSITRRGIPSENCTSICSFSPRPESWGQIGASGMVAKTTSSAFAAS
jgi:hypothetical protein